MEHPLKLKKILKNYSKNIDLSTNNNKFSPKESSHPGTKRK